MTFNKRKKNSRYRGSHTHGWGSKKKHRGSGNKGGKGRAGSGKRADAKKPSNWDDPHYFGKFGFVPAAEKLVAINVRQLDNAADTLVEKKLAEKQGDVYNIDLAKLGYDKLLSKGIPAKKLKITVNRASESAIAAVKQAGGEVIIRERRAAEKKPEQKKEEDKKKQESKE